MCILKFLPQEIKISIKRIIILPIIIGAFFYLYDIYKYNSRIIKHFRMSNPSFRLLGPYNISRTKIQDNYTKLIDLEEFRFILNTKDCESYDTGLLLIALVHSAPWKREKRSSIRNSWGKALQQLYSNTSKILFLMGTSEDPKVSQQILEESEQYGDIVQGSFKDSYRNLTYKHVMGLKWVHHHCRGAKYILKTDDDVFINMEYLLEFLVRELSPFGAVNFILCSVFDHSKPVRDEALKWYVTQEEYSGEYYPRYCNGPMILYSADVTARLLEVCEKHPYFWIDDVQVTGVCAEDIGVVPIDIGPLMLGGGRAKKLAKEGPKAVGDFIFVDIYSIEA